ncbi:agamous-like MADS-box protein AGL19 [Eucalyptus grandis]|uniref:agamous-like MADS-box protein AGL19 n=1 Tax=Eucalyptus grandis TaxID=71139 RepID=UPI00192EBA90|nr:agamous-like MADS-box protein AGL19 [Eucalyptus grandis]
MACSRRKGTDKIVDPKKCEVTFSKRSHGLIKKASDLNSLTGAPIAIIAFTPKGELRSFGTPSVDEVFFEYLRRKCDVKPSMSLKEWLDWAEKECDSCATKEDCASLIIKCQAVLNCLLKKLKDFENNLSVNAGAGDDSGVRAGPDPKVLKDDEDHSLVNDFEACHPSLLAFIKDDVDRFTSSIDSAAGGGSSEMDSDPMCSDP